MYMRLWWKDARQFWPIWVFLTLAAAATQGLVLGYAALDARGGVLGVLALCWTAFYAFAVGAAAFAGERETGTLRLLDILPASRWVVWSSKVSFALATTVALAVALLAMAALGSDPWKVWEPLLTGIRSGVPISAVVLHALCCGLFCSAIMNNAVLAAVVAICLTGLGWSGVMLRHDIVYGARYALDQTEVALNVASHLTVVAATLIASLACFTWSRRPRRAGLQFRFQSPIVITRSGSPRPRRAPVQLQAPIAVTTPAVAAPARARAVVAQVGPAGRPRPRSWVAEARSLMWETIREGRSTWCLLALVGLVLPTILLLRFPGPVDPTPIVGWSNLIALTAGISAFGLENRARTYPFLVHHGARPRVVWLVKLATWCIGLAVIWAPLVVLALNYPFLPPRPQNWLATILMLPLSFAVGQFCGMTIRRGITAGVVAVVVALALGIALFAVVEALWMPVWALLVIPAALLAVTWAWSGDWLLDPPAPGRWIRLGLMLTCMSAVLLGWYTGSRAWELPDAGPVIPPRAWAAAAAPLQPERNAADLYREAARRLAALKSPESPTHSDSATDQVLALIRDAAARPDCQFQRPDQLTMLSTLDLPPMRELAGLVGAHARDCRQRGDLEGAWNDLVVQFRMARHVGEGATINQALMALVIEMETLDRALDWATAPGQTPERLRTAIRVYRDLPRMTPPAEVAATEAILVERTIELPVDDLKGWLLKTVAANPDGTVSLWSSLLVDMITTPWDRARASRVVRLFAAEIARNAPVEPWQWRAFALTLVPGTSAEAALAHGLDSTPLAKRLIPDVGPVFEANYRSEVGRRALVQVMAIRAWQLRHKGRFPERLEDLVPDELASLPDDPYSGRPFGYERSQGMLVPPLGQVFQSSSGHATPASSSGCWLLYSVGPNGQAHHPAGQPPPGTAFNDDIVFPIPPMPADASSAKTRDKDQKGRSDD
jgi:hypothetical protein